VGGKNVIRESGLSFWVRRDATEVEGPGFLFPGSLSSRKSPQIFQLMK
jgi:hypothetical protein